MSTDPARAPVARLLGAVLLVGGGCGVDPGADAAPFELVDATAGSGLTHVSTPDGRDPRRIVEVKGGGVGLLDLENDGDHDVLALDGATLASPDRGPGARLFENLGGLVFRDVTHERGPRLDRWAMGAAVGDVDGDGYDDAYVTVFGRDALLRNVASAGGGRSLEERTEASGLGHGAWSTGCALGDLDRDGDLDLYVACYLQLDLARPPGRTRFLGFETFEGPAGLPPEPDVVYENVGDGTFRDATDASGAATPRASFGLGVVVLDLDADGDQDVLVGNDSDRNFLFRNVTPDGGPIALEEVAMASGVGVDADGHAQATMGIAVADVTGNGLPDLFTTHFSSDTNTLHANLGGLQFIDRTRPLGLGQVSRPFLGWATAFADLDHDGDEDLVAFNGHVYSEEVTLALGEEREQVPLLFERRGERFTRVREGGGAWLGASHCDRGAAFADLDRDGDVDILVRELGGPLRLLRNDGAGAKGGRSLVVALRGAAGGRGLGASVRLETDRGRQVRWILSGGSYLSSSAPEAHFGLAAGERARALFVTWPDGEVQRQEVTGDADRAVVRRDG